MNLDEPEDLVRRLPIGTMVRWVGPPLGESYIGVGCIVEIAHCVYPVASFDGHLISITSKDEVEVVPPSALFRVRDVVGSSSNGRTSGLHPDNAGSIPADSTNKI